jgi:phosphopantothenoylcysteine decarboxylase/phosphopantothenate--cysteine ligase
MKSTTHFKKAIISSGPTREWIDPVRFISNASSGKMGFQIAEEILKWIPTVVYVHGNVSDKYTNVSGAKNIYTETTLAMRDALLSELENDTLVIMAAAPADFRPIMTAENKIKKESTVALMIELEKNPDILMALNALLKDKKYTNSVLVGFAAETEKLEEHALGKLERKGLKYIIGNYVGKSNTGFGEVNSSIRIFSKTGLIKEINNQPKNILAKEISDFMKSNA